MVKDTLTYDCGALVLSSSIVKFEGEVVSSIMAVLATNRILSLISFIQAP